MGKKITPAKACTYIVLTLWALTTLYPFVWVILNSFREKGLIRKDSFSVPLPGSGFTMGNYAKAMDRFDFGGAYLNSLIVSVSVTIAVVILAGLAAYGLVRYRFKLRGLCYSLIMAGMMFPVFSTIIPVFRMEASWGIASSGNRWLSLLAVVLPQIAGNLCFATIVLMGFIESVPIELEESAYMDGCHVFQVYFHIIMPAAKPSFATVAIFSFLWSYNDLFTQNFFLRVPREKTITLLLNEISSQAGVDYGLMAASVVLIVIPVLVDDESLIVEGLRKVVDWAGHNCQVAAAAGDAASGARAIREHRPDILFTDIKMPGEDGLTMLAGLKGEFPRMQIAVLTGYRDFEYAQRAIRLGVARFLLKPSKMDELEEALDYMTGVLDRLPQEERGESPQEQGDAANSFLVRQARAYIAQHCAEKLTLQEVADHCFVSQWHLSKLLNKHLGKPFYDLLNAERVRRAKELLEDPALRISEVAERVGYADTAHFSRVFKKLEGVSAGEWRNLHCGRL